MVWEREVPESALSPHLQPQLWGQGFVLWIWVWSIIWRNSPAGKLPGGALLPLGPQRAGRLLLEETPPSQPDGTHTGLNLLPEPSALGEALLTPLPPRFPCAVRLPRAPFSLPLVLQILPYF